MSLLEGFRSLGLEAGWLPAAQIGLLRPGDVVIGRFDVRPTLDGVEEGIWELRRARLRGVRVLNDDETLLRSHDKLATAIACAQAGVPHPRTANVDETSTEPPIALPVVLKPRFGSWGQDALRCQTVQEYRSAIRRLRDRAWFRAHGVLVQELVGPQGYDLRALVAGGSVIGAIERHAKPGEWRTNVALGATRRPARLTAQTSALAAAAARAIDGDLVGIDLLPHGDDEYVVLEINGAVDFTAHYSLDGGDVFARAALNLASCAALHGVDDAVAIGDSRLALGWE
jgi:RimK family alpha-L-glutamate ligase